MGIKTIALLLAAWALACGGEPSRPMAPELDPASPQAAEPAYRPQTNPLAEEVPAPGAEPEPAEHHHHGGQAP